MKLSKQTSLYSGI